MAKKIENEKNETPAKNPYKTYKKGAIVAARAEVGSTVLVLTSEGVRRDQVKSHTNTEEAWNKTLAKYGLKRLGEWVYLSDFATVVTEAE